MVELRDYHGTPALGEARLCIAQGLDRGRESRIIHRSHDEDCDTGALLGNGWHWAGRLRRLKKLAREAKAKWCCRPVVEQRDGLVLHGDMVAVVVVAVAVVVVNRSRRSPRIKPSKNSFSRSGFHVLDAAL